MVRAHQDSLQELIATTQARKAQDPEGPGSIPGSARLFSLPAVPFARERAWVTLTKPAPNPEQANSLCQGIKHPNKILAGSTEQLRQPYKRGAAETLVIKQKTTKLQKATLFDSLSFCTQSPWGAPAFCKTHTFCQSCLISDSREGEYCRLLLSLANGDFQG